MIDEKILIAEIERQKKEAKAKWGWVIAEGVYNKILYSINHMQKSCEIQHIVDEETGDVIEVEVSNPMQEERKQSIREIYAHLDDITNNMDFMTSGNFMHHKAATKLSVKIIKDRLQAIGIKEV